MCAFRSLRTCAALALALLAAVGISSPARAEVEPVREALHVLPPLGPVSGAHEVFDDSLTPYLTVSVCRVSGGDCLSVAELTSTTGGRSNNRIWLATNYYQVNWRTEPAEGAKTVGRSFRAVQTDEYEISFLVSDIELGWVPYVGNPRRTLPIRFRVDNHPVVRAAVLHGQGVPAIEAAERLIDEFELNAGDTAWVLHQVGYGLEDLYTVLDQVFNLDVFEIEEILEGLGFSPEDILEFTARGSVAEFAPVLKFDQAMWHLPMSAERWFDRMLCGGNGPPFDGVTKEYDYHACAQWDDDNKGPDPWVNDRNVWGNPPPFGGGDPGSAGGGTMGIKPADALVDVEDDETDPDPDYWWGTNGPQGGPNVPVYFKVMKNGTTGALRIMYWWYFGYQPPCEWSGFGAGFRNGEHIGDWEHVMVTTSPDRAEIEAFTYFQHAGWYTRWASTQDSFKTEFGGQVLAAERPVVYVGKLSHGSYHNTSGKLLFFPYLGDACKYFNDQRNPKSWDDWWFTDANLVGLRSGQESWMIAERAGPPPGAELWKWGPSVKACDNPIPGGHKGWCPGEAWQPAISTHPTQEPNSWCFVSSCAENGCDWDHWAQASAQEQENWLAWCPAGPVTSLPEEPGERALETQYPRFRQR